MYVKCEHGEGHAIQNVTVRQKSFKMSREVLGDIGVGWGGGS